MAEAEIGKIEQIFDKYFNIAQKKGILCKKEDAEALAYGLDAIYDAPWRRTIFPIDAILPVQPILYEGYEFFAPHDVEGICDECYPGWPYLPNDILGHDHFSQNAFEKKGTSEALIQFALSEGSAKTAL